ncbi:heparinase II/III domain-containing protein [Agrobacterium tumefaciens]|uniref:heparinase II/III family protein n=1 Tax=Agrobacterium tumefaciens TaxID=358 RepID=UPI00287D7556|nr:heparinase II/III family protein [Agrobacterium tumefaciens]MDS7598244.1 heparinase II/III family protein [Agrobacterium tumefaciens]
MAYRRLCIGFAPLHIYASRLASRVPDGLVAAPTDLRAIDPYFAEELVRGRIALAGRMLETGGLSPFQMECPSIVFEERLNAFSWLRHVRASKSSEACARARRIVSDWIAFSGKRIGGVAWSPDIASQRLIAWLSHSPVVLNEADAGFYRRFLKSIAFHVRYLDRIAKHVPDGEVRLRIRIALAMASITMPVRASKIARSGRKLAQELERQILPDGGHVSRNPRVMLELLLDLLPLRQSYINLGHDLPSGLVPAIDRMFPALRFFRHQGGDLALFNGATATLANELVSVLRYDETAGKPSKLLPDVNYHRLSGDETVVIVDTGYPGSQELSRNAHAGCLSFEMSCGRNRFIVNSGFPKNADPEFQKASRSTAAHSTVTLADTSSCRLSRSRLLGPIMVAGVSHVETQRSQANGNDVLRASHDGYLKTFGFLHEREIEINAAGTKIKGRDTLRSNEGAPGDGVQSISAVSRFHIHPHIQLHQNDEESVYMQAADGTTWLFSAPGIEIFVADDVFMADASGIRPSQQIEIAFNLAKTREIRWIIERKA